MTENPCARRAFLRTSAAGAVGLTGLSLAACGADTDDDGTPGADAGGGEDIHLGETWEMVFATDDLPVGTSAAASVGEHDLLLHRSADEEVHAFTAVCTHQGCSVEAEDERFSCPCHGSVFAVESGEATSGPANRPLTRFEAEISDGEIRVLV